MYEEKDFAHMFGKPDDSFNENFNNTLAKLRTADTKQSKKHMSIKAVSIIIIVCIVALGSTAYAISTFTMQFMGNKETIDTGGGLILIGVTENKWKDTAEIGFKGIYFADISAELQPRINALHVEALRLLFDGEIFATNGRRSRRSKRHLRRIDPENS